MDHGRHDQWSREIGRRGERWALEAERRRVASLGGDPTAVIWRSERNPFAPHDIESLDEDGLRIYIEVKTTTSADPSDPFTISDSELLEALRHRSRYYVYRVFDVTAAGLKVKRFQDPIGHRFVAVECGRRREAGRLEHLQRLLHLLRRSADHDDMEVGAATERASTCGSASSRSFVDDQDEARDFHTDVLGHYFKDDARYGDSSGWLTVVSPDEPDGPQLLLNDVAAPLQAERREAGKPAVSFITDDCRHSHEELAAPGAVFVVEPRSLGHGGIDAVFQDGCGNLRNLHLG